MVNGDLSRSPEGRPPGRRRGERGRKLLAARVRVSCSGVRVGGVAEAEGDRRVVYPVTDVRDPAQRLGLCNEALRFSL